MQKHPFRDLHTDEGTVPCALFQSSCSRPLVFALLFVFALQLTLRKVMDSAKAASKTGQISEFSMVLLNNALSFPPAIVLILLFGEMRFIVQSCVLPNPTLACFSPVLTLGVTKLVTFMIPGFTAFSCRKCQSPLVYGLDGSWFLIFDPCVSI